MIWRETKYCIHWVYRLGVEAVLHKCKRSGLKLSRIICYSVGSRISAWPSCRTAVWYLYIVPEYLDRNGTYSTRNDGENPFDPYGALHQRRSKVMPQNSLHTAQTWQWLNPYGQSSRMTNISNNRSTSDERIWCQDLGLLMIRISKLYQIYLLSSVLLLVWCLTLTTLTHCELWMCTVTTTAVTLTSITFQYPARRRRSFCAVCYPYTNIC